MPNSVSSNAGIQTLTVPKKLTIGGNINCPDIALQLRYDPETPYWGILALTTPGNYQSYTSIAQEPTPKGDLVLSAENARDIILTTKNNTGKIRFATSQVINSDEERMTIIPTGQVGIKNDEPKNLLSIRNTIGMDFYNNQEYLQDIRLNCYASGMQDLKDGIGTDTLQVDSYDQTVYKNVTAGYSGIIQNFTSQNQGKLLIASSKYNSSPNGTLDFFDYVYTTLEEDDIFSPRGIILQNYTYQSQEYVNIGLGSEGDYLSRVKIRGINSSSNMNALKIEDWANNPLFLVRNDGKVGIGTEAPSEKLEVNGNTKINGDLEISGVINFENFTIDSWHFDSNWGLTTEGRVGIGEKKITSNSSYWSNSLLCVYGPIITTELVVIPEGNGDWADFVFDEKYNLIPLEKLEENIKLKKHLPDMPSADEIKRNGVNVFEMQSKLLQKIEELTLYIIELKKENERLNKRLVKIENKKSK